MFKKFSPRLRFSLRALLVILTLGGIALGIVVSRAERQRKAVAWIKEHRGNVRYAHVKVSVKQGLAQQTEVLPAPKWLIDTLGEHYFFRPISIELNHLEGNEDLHLLCGLPAVERVSFDHSHVTASQLRQISQMPGFRTLGFQDAQLADDALAELRSAKNLQILSAMYCQLSAENTKALFELAPLKEIYFWTCELDLSQVGDGSRLTNLEVLYFAKGTKAKAGGLGQLSPLPKLREMMISAEWTPDTYAALARQKALSRVYVYNGELNQAELANLTAMPALREIDLECIWTPEATAFRTTLPAHISLTSRPPRGRAYQWDFEKRDWQDTNTSKP